MSNLLFATPKELTGWLSKLASGKRVMAPRQEGPSVVFRAYTAKELAAADVNALLKRSYSFFYSSKSFCISNSFLLSSSYYFFLSSSISISFLRLFSASFFLRSLLTG